MSGATDLAAWGSSSLIVLEEKRKGRMSNEVCVDAFAVKGLEPHDVDGGMIGLEPLVAASRG